jgi:hypothetical protein
MDAGLELKDPHDLAGERFVDAAVKSDHRLVGGFITANKQTDK